MASDYRSSYSTYAASSHGVVETFPCARARDGAPWSRDLIRVTSRVIIARQKDHTRKWKTSARAVWPC
jgi:hypothetical protein